MSKVIAATLASLFVLPLLANPALASKNVGSHTISTTTMATSNCTTVLVPEWKCPAGKSPGDFVCTMVWVKQTVCHGA